MATKMFLSYRLKPETDVDESTPALYHGPKVTV
jgi:hypothetical protein